MQTKPRRILIGSAASPLLLAAATNGGVYNLSRQDWRGPISDRACTALGRQVTIRGSVRLTLSHHAIMTVDEVTIANAPWGSRPQMADIRHLGVRLALIPLLFGHTELDDLQLVGLNALLERNRDGRGNWQSRSALTDTAAAYSAVSSQSPDADAPASNGAGSSLPPNL